MNWPSILIGFALAVFTGSAMVALLRSIRPHWSARRRRLTAASILPAITAIATLIGMAIVVTSDHGQGEQMEDLALAALLTIGGGFMVLAWIGGLLGATLTSRRQGG